MTYEIRVESRQEQHAAVVHEQVPLEALPGFLGEAFGEVGVVLAQQGLFPNGPPFGRYRVVPDGFDVAAGFTTTGPVRPSGRVEPTLLPGGEIAETVHVGSYEGVAEAYAAVSAWLEAQDREPTGDPWEMYLDDADVADPRTVVCFPCRRKALG